MDKDKYVGISKVGEKGQIVIPAEARKMFGIMPGDSLIVLCDKERGMALVKSDVFEDITDKLFDIKPSDTKGDTDSGKHN